MSTEIQRLTQCLLTPFHDQDLLTLAVTHRSFNGSQNNERLEFLGDSILNFIIGEALFKKFPKAKEGQLSRLRAKLVKGTTLTKVAKHIDLGPFLLLGPGEMKSGGARRDSILADAVEAIIGAIFLDAGMDQAKQQVLSWFQPLLADLSLEDTVKDNKTRLQEYLQGQKLALPTYNILDVSGKSHNQHFVVECVIEQLALSAEGKGQSRRVAEQMAAGEILQHIQSDGLK